MRKLIDENINTQKLLRIACLLLADIVIINLSAVAALSSALRAVAGTGVGSRIYQQRHILHVAQHTRHRDNLLIFGLYNSLWEFAGVHELVRIALASACSGAAVWLGMLLLGLPVPRSYPFLHSGAVRRGLVPALYLPSAAQSARRF